MFTQAGYDLRGACRWKIWACVRVQGTKRRAWAQIIEFRRGDLAWYSSQARFLKWGTQVRIIGRFVGPTPFGHFLLEFPQSKL